MCRTGRSPRHHLHWRCRAGTPEDSPHPQVLVPLWLLPGAQKHQKGDLRAHAGTKNAKRGNCFFPITSRLTRQQPVDLTNKYQHLCSRLAGLPTQVFNYIPFIWQQHALITSSHECQAIGTKAGNSEQVVGMTAGFISSSSSLAFLHDHIHTISMNLCMLY